MKVKNKNALVYGLSVSGEWAVKLLNKLGANVYVYDDDKEIYKNKNLINCFLVQNFDENAVKGLDFVIVSPSIDKDNPILKIIDKEKIRVYSEIEFASLYCKNILAVTGTNGKTTTVELITAILNTKYNAIACGNIGYPLSRAVLENKHAIKVVEVSSFMLEHAQEFHPYIATVLNVEPDHLVRHKTYDEYFKLKRSIFSNLSSTDYAVVNLDKNIHPNKNAMTITYSQTHSADVYLKNGYIYLHQRQLIAINKLKMKGKHNIQNIMCAICFANIMKVPDSDIVKTLLAFTPDEFRCQFVGKVENVTFINDSKSTNIASCLACVEAVRGAIILLVGGSFKGLDYTELFKKLPHKVKSLVAFGEIADSLIEANNNSFPITACSNLSKAFDYAVSIAKSGDSVVLSPASASYDEFKNYKERGRTFNIKVQEYEHQKK